MHIFTQTVCKWARRNMPRVHRPSQHAEQLNLASQPAAPTGTGSSSAAASSVQHEAEDELTRREAEERAREEEPASHARAQAEARTSREAQDRVRREAEAPSDSRSDLAHETPQAAEAAEEVRVSSAPHEAERGLRLRCSARPTAQPEAEQDGIVERPAKSPARTRPPAARPMQSPAGVRHQHGVYELLERVVTGVVMVGAGWLASWSVARLSTMSSDAGLQWVRDWFTPKP